VVLNLGEVVAGKVNWKLSDHRLIFLKLTRKFSSTLTFSGETKSEKRDDTEVYHRVERSYGKFSRSVRLPKNTDFDNIKANMDQGVLNIAIPKKQEQTKTRAVNVQ